MEKPKTDPQPWKITVHNKFTDPGNPDCIYQVTGPDLAGQDTTVGALQKLPLLPPYTPRRPHPMGSLSAMNSLHRVLETHGNEIRQEYLEQIPPTAAAPATGTPRTPWNPRSTSDSMTTPTRYPTPRTNLKGVNSGHRFRYNYPSTTRHHIEPTELHQGTKRCQTI